MPFPLDTATFADRFPEFASVVESHVALVQGKLAEAATEIDETVWGESAENGHGYLAADLLVTSPFGMQAGLRPADAKGDSVYRTRFLELSRRVGTAYRLVLE